MNVYLIGAGPGDPGLLTVKAAGIIPRCDAVVYDDLIPDEVLLMAKPSAEKYYVGKRAGKDYMKQPQINRLLLELSKRGLTIARLKGGDPCVFGRGGEEALFLKENGIPFEIIPGISSAIAGPVSAGIPPTHRGLAASLKIVTAHEDPLKESGFLDWKLLAKETGTLVFLMGAGRINEITEALTREGMDPLTPCAIIQDATLASQRHIVSTLADIGVEAGKIGIGSPCIIVVGRVAGLSKELFSSTDKPLSGRNVLITRPAHLAHKTADAFKAQGAQVFIYPLIELREIAFSIDDVSKYNMIVFTSQNAVPLFFKSLSAVGLDSRALSGKEIVCIGPKTRDALLSFGIRADKMAEEFRAEGIMDLFEGRDLKGLKICLPRAKGARPYLSDSLKSRGAEVEEISVYETAMPDKADAENFVSLACRCDTIIFTSPSGARNAVLLAGDRIDEIRTKTLIAIGPVTAGAMKELGLTATASASEYTDEGILALLKGDVS
jgi:uroporphyrinogen III methyltransferase / synthase